MSDILKKKKIDRFKFLKQLYEESGTIKPSADE